MATVSDRVLPEAVTGTPTAVRGYTADIVTASDYYPFEMVSRAFNSPSVNYRYGFNGQEVDNEIAGIGNSLHAEFWQYDPRVGRRWNLDPKPTVGISEYAAFNNSPIIFSDPKGDTSGVGTRIWGGLKAIGGIAEMAIGGAGGVATSWTGVGAVAGGAAVVHGADVTSAGLRQLWTGEETSTFTQQGISKGLQGLGVSEPKADVAAGYTDAGISILLSGGSGMAKDGTLVASRPLLFQVGKTEKVSKIIPRGFNDAEQFTQVGSELKIALQESGIQFSNIGVRGSAVTNVSSKGGAFRETALGNLKSSDIDVYVELTQEIGLKASENIEGFIHPGKLFEKFPALEKWSEKWSQVLGREITPGAFNPGTFKDVDVIKF